MPKPPSGWTEVPNKSDTWIAAWLFRWSPVFNAWVDSRVSVTVKPGDTANDAIARRVGEVSPSDSLFYRDV